MVTKQKKQVTDDNVTTTVGEIRYFDLICIYLVINILSRLPLKYIAKCRCVSKLWSSIIRRPNHKQLFPIKSPATPSLLFVGHPPRIQPELWFFSSPHTQIQDKNSSSFIPRHLTKTVADYCRLCPPVAGLICRQQSGENYTFFAVVSNPVTGEYVTTPKVTREGFETKGEIYFGYDPIEQHFKVLSMTWSLPRDGGGSHKCQVVTLMNGNLSWREIQCCTFHYPQAEDDDKGICINGVLYYTATVDSKRRRTIVCFDVRSEKFSFIDFPDEYLAKKIYEPLILIDFKGELGVIHCGYSKFFVLWVLKDALEQKWLEQVYKFPEMPHSRLTSGAPVFSAGMIGTDEIVFYNKYGRNPFDIFCYNIEKEVITRLGIVVPTLDWVETREVEIFSNFVEDAKLMF